MIGSYGEFWDFYVQEHSKPLTRALHFAGTTLGLALLFVLIWRGLWWLLPASLIVGYAFAWFAHFVVERNRPATFKYPLWSFVSDYKMMWFMLTGRMRREVERVNSTR